MKNDCKNNKNRKHSQENKKIRFVDEDGHKRSLNILESDQISIAQYCEDNQEWIEFMEKFGNDWERKAVKILKLVANSN
ncbi:hypothetical protein Metev_0142 [Methanohalobium evestigatum Z-7303]|uniref:Uncharacterized protein n=1 Tax=Methanohalobium evestigatum (strain ATCC BAA-1072 / DSM 3721 / NBRC 107634 / OCM 161 / Z-7303) TaxID=644295 RepID=D7E651_METEZ|nr:hypothetical protein [Methanohalobium evestigatum]ADI73073.1 hypothetical protein Metev_0142 [Methanohalobium evestigatum Z-7303]